MSNKKKQPTARWVCNECGSDDVSVLYTVAFKEYRSRVVPRYNVFARIVEENFQPDFLFCLACENDSDRPLHIDFSRFTDRFADVATDQVQP